MIPYSLNTELIEIGQKLENRKQVSEKLKKAKSVYQTEASILETLKVQMQNEFKDVKDLEKTTLKSIWYDLLNKKFSELEREQEEYYQAKMHFEVQKNKVESLAFEIKTFEAQLTDLQTLKTHQESLLKEKLKLLSENNHPKISEVFEKQEILIKINSNIKEIEDALSVLENVLMILPNVIQDLKSAKSYANWDTFGGGSGATYMKRKKMRDANLGIIEINYVLNRLNRELKDISPDILPPSVELNMSSEFADYFFDNFFVDLKIRNHINDAYNQILTLFDSMIVLKGKLMGERNKQQELYDETDSQIKQLIEQS